MNKVESTICAMADAIRAGKLSAVGEFDVREMGYTSISSDDFDLSMRKPFRMPDWYEINFRLECVKKKEDQA